MQFVTLILVPDIIYSDIGKFVWSTYVWLMSNFIIQPVKFDVFVICRIAVSVGIKSLQSLFVSWLFPWLARFQPQRQGLTIKHPW